MIDFISNAETQTIQYVVYGCFAISVVVVGLILRQLAKPSLPQIANQDYFDMALAIQRTWRRIHGKQNELYCGFCYAPNVSKDGDFIHEKECPVLVADKVIATFSSSDTDNDGNLDRNAGFTFTGELDMREKEVSDGCP